MKLLLVWNETDRHSGDSSTEVIAADTTAELIRAVKNSAQAMVAAARADGLDDEALEAVYGGSVVGALYELSDKAAGHNPYTSAERIVKLYTFLALDGEITDLLAE